MSEQTLPRAGALFLTLVLVASSLGVVAVFATSAGATTLSLRPGGGSSATPDVNYQISFTETGLPANLTWQVTVGRISESYFTDGNTDSLSFSEPSGTYTYTITNIPGWKQTNLSYTGSVVVSGASVNEPTLYYSPVTYPVVFAESGLPVGINWTITLGGVPQTFTSDGATDSLTFLEPNGTYAYQVTDISGWAQTTIPGSGSIVVAGAGITKPTLVYTEVTYSVAFSESGLPSGFLFEVTVNGDTKSLTTTGGTGTLTWTGLPNGTYSYLITGVAGWSQSTLAGSGDVVVNGAGVTEPTLVYTKVTYSVVFTENGLPSGLIWEVTLGRVAEEVLTDGGADIISFTEGNGSYSYTVSVVSGWAQDTLPGTGTIVVAGASVTATAANYTEVTYLITFTEADLPLGTNWSITIGATTENSTGPTIIFVEPNGTYGYTLGIVPGFVPTPSHGSITLTGTGAGIGIAFAVKLYAVYFNETGLPAATDWSVTIGSTESSTGASILFHEANGTYGYTIGIVSGWVPTSDAGTVTVNGAEVTQGVEFTQVFYTVLFTEHGLPTHGAATRWSVAFDGTLRSTTGATISFPASNGSYSYLIRGPGGWEVPATLAPQGTIVVNGAGISQTVSFLRGPTETISAHETGLASGTPWCLTIGAAFCGTGRTVSVANLTPASYSYAIESFAGLTTEVKEKGVAVAASGTVSAPPSTTFQVRYTFPLTFTESGLPAATEWKVASGGQTVTSTSTTVVVYLTNGTYGFSVGHVTGYVASPSTGHVAVTGAPIFVSIHFAHAPTHSPAATPAAAVRSAASPRRA